MFSNPFRFFRIFFLSIFGIIAGCYYGSISDFSETDIVGLENGLHNPSFEDGEYAPDHLPSGWISLDAKAGELVWDNSVSKDQARSLRVEEDGKVALVSEAFDIKPSNVYYSRVFTKGDRISQKVTISFVTFNKNGKKLDKFSESHNVLGEWIPVSITTGFFDGAAVFGRLIITIDSKSGYNLWLDDAGSYVVYEIK